MGRAALLLPLCTSLLAFGWLHYHAAVQRASHQPSSFSHVPWRRALLQEDAVCRPESVPKEQQCHYARTAPECAPSSGIVPYQALWTCIDNPPLASLLLLAWLVVLFSLMYIASDAFFCPTLELVSDHLRLTPAVAGATLLAFETGAPDVMTILASLHSGAQKGEKLSSSAVSMALSEPLGTGLFVGNMVLGLVVLVSRASHKVTLCPIHFFKDVAFYLLALGTVLYCLLDGQAFLWQGVSLVLLYFAYMACSIWMPRDTDKEPAIPPEQMTLVPHGPWDDIPAEEVEGCDWEDVIDKETPQAQARKDVLPVAGISHLAWSSEWRSRGRGWLGSGASGELVEDGEGEPAFASDEHEPNKSTQGSESSRLGWLPRRQNRRQRGGRQRRWSVGDALGTGGRQMSAKLSGWITGGSALKSPGQRAPKQEQQPLLEDGTASPAHAHNGQHAHAERQWAGDNNDNDDDEVLVGGFALRRDGSAALPASCFKGYTHTMSSPGGVAHTGGVGPGYKGWGRTEGER